MIAKNDEVKRSRIWKTVTLVSSILIVLIAVFLITKLFTTNPLEGSWEDENGKLGMTVEAGDSLLLFLPEAEDGKGLEIPMRYTLDRDAKTITIRLDSEELQGIAEDSDGQLSVETLEEAAGSLNNTFDYSVDGDTLTLSEREYGDQIILIKQ